MKKKRFKPGQRVPLSGVYRVHHTSHRLMHEATLLEEDLFPLCRRCGAFVRFELVHVVSRGRVLPFRPSVILEEFTEPELSILKAG